MNLLKAVAATAAALALTGCGNIHPGAAAVVGDTEISREQLNDVVDAACVAQQRRAQEGQSFSIPFLAGRAQFLDEMIGTELARQFAASQGVQVNQTEVNAAMQSEGYLALTEPDEAALLAELKSKTEASNLLTQVGRKEVGAKAGVDQANSAGQKAFAAWLGKHAGRVRVDPRYNPGKSGRVGAGDGSVSKPYSSFAKSVAGASKDYPTLLPASQLCSRS